MVYATYAIFYSHIIIPQGDTSRYSIPLDSVSLIDCQVHSINRDLILA